MGSSALIRRVERSNLLGGEVLAGKLTTTVIKNRFNRLLATTRGLEYTVAGSGSGDVTKHDQSLLDELRAVAKDIEEFLSYRLLRNSHCEIASRR
jgi:hypothetical protein